MRKILALLTLIVFLTSCSSMSKTQKGALIGATTGALTGGLVDKNKRYRGGLIGAAVGGLTGAYIGKQEDRNDVNQQEQAALREEIYRSESASKDRERQTFASSFRSVIIFDSRSSMLNSAAHREVGYVASRLNQYPDTKILIKGFTENYGSYNDNMTLSRNRAEAVKNALIEQGISPSRIFASGYGPSSSGDSDYNRQMSERVEITVDSQY
jgi:outer membrane protein OmpA-like peptidoglycan-associated protein